MPLAPVCRRLNDINILNQSPLYLDVTAGWRPPRGVTFTVNGITCTLHDYLVDGIYPSYAFLVSPHPIPMTDEAKTFNCLQQATRKDVERLLGVLTKRFHIALHPGRYRPVKQSINTVSPARGHTVSKRHTLYLWPSCLCSLPSASDRDYFGNVCVLHAGQNSLQAEHAPQFSALLLGRQTQQLLLPKDCGRAYRERREAVGREVGRARGSRHGGGCRVARDRKRCPVRLFGTRHGTGVSVGWTTPGWPPSKIMKVADRRDAAGIAAGRGQVPGRGQPHEAREDPDLNAGQAPRIPIQPSTAPPATHTLSELSAPPIQAHQSTPNNVFLKSECVYVSETCPPNAPRGSI